MSGAESDSSDKDAWNKPPYAVYSALMDHMSGIENTALENRAVKYNDRRIFQKCSVRRRSKMCWLRGKEIGENE